MSELFTFDAAPVSDSPKIQYFGESDTHPLTFWKIPSNIGTGKIIELENRRKVGLLHIRPNKIVWKNIDAHPS